MQRAGAVGVSDDGKPILNDSVMRETLRLSSEINLPVIQHAEDTRMTDRCSMNDGPTAFRLGLRGMKAAAEASVVERDVQLAQQFTGARLHVAHLSTADALKAVRRGKRSKSHVTCEVTPHHFALTDADVGEYDTNFKMNPPLRSDSDREAILVALADGTDRCDCHRSRAPRAARKDHRVRARGFRDHRPRDRARPRHHSPSSRTEDSAQQDCRTLYFRSGARVQPERTWDADSRQPCRCHDLRSAEALDV